MSCGGGPWNKRIRGCGGEFRLEERTLYLGFPSSPRFRRCDRQFGGMRIIAIHLCQKDDGDHERGLALCEGSPHVCHAGPTLLTNRGGLELLFAHKRNFPFSLPKTFGEHSQPSNINFLIKQLCEREMKDKRKELFVKDDTV